MNMKGSRKAITALAAIAVCGLISVGLPSAAQADEIVFGASSQNITFTALGGDLIGVSISALTGSALFQADIGTYAFGATSFSAGPQVGSQFPAGANSESFSFTSTSDADTLSGTVVWSFIQDDTQQPKFFGTLDIASASGDAAFLSNFSAGGSGGVDFTTNT